MSLGVGSSPTGTNGIPGIKRHKQLRAMSSLFVNKWEWERTAPKGWAGDT